MGHIEEEKKRLLADMANFGSDGSGPAQLSMLLTQAEAEERLSLEQVAEEDSALARLKSRLASVDEQRLTTLNSFVARNPELSGLLEAHHAGLNEFDLFETLNLYWREEVHSSTWSKLKCQDRDGRVWLWRPGQ